ncbi:hypothetical protein [Streptomyces sp. NPDC001843]|uniref:hypothetical protein n=1 Tax=Streptomyces sp. NPDC001843 TaxID=3364617 RepID=UPI00369CB796
MRVKKWAEDARTEWPDPEPGGRGLPVTGAEAQSFPETVTTDVLSDGAVPDAAPTEVLPAAQAPGSAGPADDDPHELTVRLDTDRIAELRLSGAKAVGDAGRRRPAERGRPPHAGRRDAPDGPVFVDASGRRSRTFRRLGMFVGIACAAYAVVIAATLLSGSSDAPWLPVPGQKENKPAGQVDISPVPADPARPSGRVGAAPGTRPTPPAAPAPGGSAAVPGTTRGTVKQPDTSADPRPTPTAPSGPATGGSSPDPEPSAPTPSVTPPPPTGPAVGSGSPSPSLSSGPDTGTGSGTGTGTHI